MNQVTLRANDIRMQLYVFPSALVAWADGRVDPSEREMIQNIAASLVANGADEGAAHHRWCERIPTQEEVERWSKLVRAFLPRIAAPLREDFVAQTKKNLWRVARCSGGPHPVCANERAVITRIEQIMRTAVA